MKRREDLSMENSGKPNKYGFKPVETFNLNPNAISGIRIILAPIVVSLLMWHTPRSMIAALAVLIVADLTDAIDGWVARRFDRESDFGRIFDPFCDSVLHISVFITLSGVYGLFVLVPLVFFARDFTVWLFRAQAGYKGRVLAARLTGKWKTLLQIVFQYVFIAYAFVGLTDAVQGPRLLWWLWVVCGLSGSSAIGMTLFSLLDYVLYESRQVLTDRRGS